MLRQRPGSDEALEDIYRLWIAENVANRVSSGSWCCLFVMERFFPRRSFYSRPRLYIQRLRASLSP
jgi:hypothetical protein